MQRGGTKASYFIANYFINLLNWSIGSLVFYGCVWLAIGLTDFWLLLLIFCIVDPLFNAVISYICFSKLDLSMVSVGLILNVPSLFLWLIVQS